MKREEEVGKVVDEMAERLMDEGRLIEAGWLSLRALYVAADAPAVQIDEMRNAFFAGAQHLFGSLMGTLRKGDDEDPTEADLTRLTLISAELDQFIAEYSARHGLTGRRPRQERSDHRGAYDEPPPSRAEQFAAQAPQDRLGDAPVEADFHAKMLAVMQTVDEFFNGEDKGAARKVGVLLLVTALDRPEGARTNFMSNGLDRKDVATLFKEMLARFEGQPEVRGTA